MMVEPWALVLLALALIGCASYISYLLREVKLYQRDVAMLVSVLHMVEDTMRKEAEDGETLH